MKISPFTENRNNVQVEKTNFEPSLLHLLLQVL